jgi:hemolysin activation/secretion protein
MYLPKKLIFFICLSISFINFSYAQTQPDSGTIIQENAPVLEPTKPSDLNIEILKDNRILEKSGTQVLIKDIIFEGNKVITNEEIKKYLGNFSGKKFYFSELLNFTNLISNLYKEKGFSFSRAYLPPQSIKDGFLIIKITEGEYGEINSIGDQSIAPQAKNFLSKLKPGNPIYGPSLEKDLLILDDQPGIKITPLIRPGNIVGTGDLDVRVDKEKKNYGINFNFDTFGNRYTGKERKRISGYYNSPLIFGDQILFSILHTDEDMLFGFLNYNFPILYSGLRGRLGLSHTYYELGKEYENLESNGKADTISFGLQYPLIRSQKSNLKFDIEYNLKSLYDEQGTAGTYDHKNSSTLPLSLIFDIRDQIGLGAVTYGSLAWTPGILDLGGGSDKSNDINAKTDGNFNKINFDLARIQQLSEKISLFGRVSTQLTFDNLDSSESFGLGGVNGVRAFPSGESFGDEGSLAQIELRYSTMLYKKFKFDPFVFFDVGTIKTNHNNYTTDANTRDLSGGGFGIRSTYLNISLDANVAWRTSGGPPESDSKNDMPTVWINFSYQM